MGLGQKASVRNAVVGAVDIAEPASDHRSLHLVLAPRGLIAERDQDISDTWPQ
jgi:hypothetical protein